MTLELIRSAQFADGETKWEIEIPAVGYRKVVTVPDQSTSRLHDLT